MLILSHYRNTTVWCALWDGGIIDAKNGAQCSHCSQCSQMYEAIVANSVTFKYILFVDTLFHYRMQQKVCFSGN